MYNIYLVDIETKNVLQSYDSPILPMKDDLIALDESKVEVFHVIHRIISNSDNSRIMCMGKIKNLITYLN